MIEDILFILTNTLIYMVPILLAAVGEIITERAGIVNIGLEGIFILSSFSATVVAFSTGNPYLGFLVGILVGSLSGMLHGVISVYLRGDQIIAGVGYNSFAYGISVMGLITLWKQYGASPTVPTIPVITIAEKYSISPITPLAIVIAIAAWYWLFKTTSGLKLRACGEDPRSAESMGVNVFRTRFYATILGATLTGIGGAYLSVGWIGQFTRYISAGRGFIALANVAFSNWNPLLAIIGGMVFGFFDVLAIYLQIKAQTVLAIPAAYSYLFKTIPYIGTLAVVSIFIKRARIPKALGKPYIKE
ncbi:MAG: ABC transporter permease [Desulfurococcales archaeon]|nr:ABC transporter permease [Desulfurococcales archaeon]